MQPKIVFFGTPEFAVASLDAMVQNGCDVVAVVTMPDKPAGRGHHMYQSPVKEYAVSHNIPVLQPVKLKDPEFVDALRNLNADLFVVIAFRMLPEVVWTMPPLGTFNLHASLLPKYRGAAPINWAVINGETETGVTTFFLQHEIDTGNIISQEKIAIAPDENVGSVHDRLMELGASLTVETIKRIAAGNLSSTPQSELMTDCEPTPAPKIFKETCRIDWGKPARDIYNQIRGLSPYPAAWCEFNGTTLKIFSAQLTDAPEDLTADCGLTVADGCLIAHASDGGCLEITEVQPAGKRRMSAAEYLRGARLS